MSKMQFDIFSSWDPRPETPKELGRRMLKNLDALRGLGPHFQDWWFMDHSRPALEMNRENFHEYLLPLDETMRGRMTEMVELGVRRGDYGEPRPNGGYTITASNSVGNSPYYACLNAHGGGIVDPRAGYRMAEFRASTLSDSDPGIVSYPLFRTVLLSIIAAWDVRHAQAYSEALTTLWHEPSKLFLDLAWMTYLSPDLAEGVTPPGDVLVETTAEGGLLMIAAEEIFDTANPKHMAAARGILEALADVNAAEEKKWQRL